MKRKEFTQEQIELIIDLYVKEHLSMRKIGEKFNVSKTVISRILNEQKIEKHKDTHIYFADYRKFKDIDTAEKAYWLGFIAADGCVYVREHNSSIIISIHRKDKEHLEKFKKFMNSNVNIMEFENRSGFSEKNHSPMCKIVFNSIEMANDMISHGVTPRKSNTLDIPKIDEKFFLPFLLGFFDGDGTIYKFNNNTEFTIGFIGTYNMMNWINSLLEFNAKLEKRYSDKETYYIRCGGTRKPYNILKRLYNSVNVHLDRKYDLFKELENVVLNRNIK